MKKIRLSREVQAVNRALHRIVYARYRLRVEQSLRVKAEIQDRVRARSLAGAHGVVFD